MRRATVDGRADPSHLGGIDPVFAEGPRTLKRLLLVRHGETEWNALRRLQGQTDIALSPRGADQARALAPMIAGLAPGLALSSDLSRARETATLLGHEDATLEPRLREQDLGDWTGRDIAEIVQTAPRDYAEWRAGRFTPEGAESWAAFRARLGAVLDEAVKAPAETVLLVCHGGAIRAALEAGLGLPAARVVPVAPASLTILSHTGSGLRIEALNVPAGGALELDAPD